MANIKELSKVLPILDFDHKSEPTWGKDSGRHSNSGTWSGTFKGYCSQLTIVFGETTQTEMNRIISEFEKGIVSVTYPAKNGTIKTENFYGTAINGKVDTWGGMYKGFTLTLTGVKITK